MLLVSGSFACWFELVYDAKVVLAEVVLLLLDGACVIVFDSGTTVFELVWWLFNVYDGMVVINLLLIVIAFVVHLCVEVVLFGGWLNKDA